MAFLDDIFDKPFPSIQVRGDLHRLYTADVQAKATVEDWEEFDFYNELKSVSHYLRFLGELRDIIDLEIKGVNEQLEAVKEHNKDGQAS